MPFTNFARFLHTCFSSHRASSLPKHEGEDLAQTAALRLWQRGKKVPIGHPAAFFARVARNLAIDEARRLRVRGGVALALDELDDASTPWVAPDQETALLLKQVILGLPPLYRDVFILSRFMGLTYGEISQRLDVPLKTVEFRMSRALALCRSALAD